MASPLYMAPTRCRRAKKWRSWDISISAIICSIYLCRQMEREFGEPAWLVTIVFEVERLAVVLAPHQRPDSWCLLFKV